MDPVRSSRFIRLAALAGVTCISFAAILVRLAETNPATTTVFRAAYAIPALLVWRAWQRADDRRPARTRILAVGAGLILAFDLTAWHVSIEAIGAGLATVLANTQVVFVALLAWWLHRERPTGLALAVIPVVFGGVVLISGLGRADAFGDDPWKGVAFGVLAGVSYAAFILALRHANRGRLAPTVGPLLDATLGTLVGGLIAGIVAGGLVGPLDLAPTWPAHGWLMALGVLAQAAGWGLISYALPRLAAIETSVVILAQPALTILWARLVFGEAMSTVQWVGVAVVITGLLALNLRSAVKTSPAPPPHPDTVGAV